MWDSARHAQAQGLARRIQAAAELRSRHRACQTKPKLIEETTFQTTGRLTRDSRPGRLTRYSQISGCVFAKVPGKSGKSLFWTPGTKIKFVFF